MATVLVVEDTKEIAALVRFKLLSAGYNVIVAEDGKKGLETAKSLLPDLIILDVMMPVMNGLETLMNLKSDQACRTIPVIMLTAQSTEQEIIRGLELGADDYVTKPFSPQELLVRVKTVLARRQKPSR
ncbi:MAG: response regulator [Bacteroidetes bacterium]|nr:response regulator [Bacteroidota bacterium]MCL5737907.1 response regulator [Bacteroidota bacterium]